MELNSSTFKGNSTTIGVTCIWCCLIAATNFSANGDHRDASQNYWTFWLIKCYFRKVLPLRWLRDHDRSSTGYNHKTFQRKVDTFSIEPTILKIKNIREENSVIYIQWVDGVETEYPAAFVRDAINLKTKDRMTTINTVSEKRYIKNETFDSTVEFLPHKIELGLSSNRVPQVNSIA